MAAIHPDLEEVSFSVQVSYDDAVVDTHDSQLAAGENTISFTSTNWTGGITFKASFVGANQIIIETTIGGITEESSAWFTWSGTGYAGSFQTSNGYLIEVAELDYFDEPNPVEEPTDETSTTAAELIPYFYRLELVGAFMIGIMLWQVLIKSWRSQSLYL